MPMFIKILTHANSINLWSHCILLSSEREIIFPLLWLNFISILGQLFDLWLTMLMLHFKLYIHKKEKDKNGYCFKLRPQKMWLRVCHSVHMLLFMMAA